MKYDIYVFGGYMRNRDYEYNELAVRIVRRYKNYDIIEYNGVNPVPITRRKPKTKPVIVNQPTITKKRITKTNFSGLRRRKK